MLLTFVFPFTNRIDILFTVFLALGLCLGVWISLTYCFVFLDFFILFLRASIHHFLLRSYFLGFSVDPRRFSVMMVVKDAVNLSTLVFSLHIFPSRSKFIEYFAIRLERWSRSINLSCGFHIYHFGSLLVSHCLPRVFLEALHLPCNVLCSLFGCYLLFEPSSSACLTVLVTTTASFTCFSTAC